MPFLGDLDKKLHLNRLETPRVKVPKGSIGITEQFCNIYTFESPGGWNIIGNTPLEVFDSSKEKNPNLISSFFFSAIEVAFLSSRSFLICLNITSISRFVSENVT